MRISPGARATRQNALPLAHRAYGTPVPLVQLQLGDLFDRARRRVVRLEGHLERAVHPKRRGLQAEVGILHLAVGQAVAEGGERCALSLPWSAWSSRQRAASSGAPPCPALRGDARRLEIATTTVPNLRSLATTRWSSILERGQA